MVECEISKTCLVDEAPVCVQQRHLITHLPTFGDLVVERAARRGHNHGEREAGSRKERGVSVRFGAGEAGFCPSPSSGSAD